VIVAEIIARLADANAFAMIEGAAELAALKDAAPPASPAAYVFIDEEAAEPNDRMNAVLQRVEVDVSVVIMATNVSDATGGAGSDDVETLKAAATAVLVGWQPESAADVVTYVGARLVRARSGTVTVEMTFATAFYLESL
jgi:hypothetical protein